MYKESFAAAASAAQKKFNLLKTNPAGYVVLSILAGMYIGFGILLAFMVGGQLGTNPAANLLGAGILAWMFVKSGLDLPVTATVFTKAAAAKMAAPAGQLFLRGILCNILVCLAVWSGFQTKSDSAKLIMIFWCLLAFFSTGFEHSVANMTTFIVALLNPVQGAGAVSAGGMFYNLLWVTLGNMAGGIVFVALPYWLAAKDKQ